MVVITWLTERIDLLRGCSVFIDDVQCALGTYSTEADLGNFIDSLQAPGIGAALVLCDVAQCWFYSVSCQHLGQFASLLSTKLTHDQLVILSTNLRNTFDISNVLSIIRDRIINLCSNPNILLTRQSPGHYIHGPRIVVHVFKDNNIDSIGAVLNSELEVVCKDGILNYSNIGLIYNYLEDDMKSMVQNTLSSRSYRAGNSISLCDSGNIYSVEFPAVVVLHRMWGEKGRRHHYIYGEQPQHDNLQQLYLEMSRALVRCAVILYPGQGKSLEELGLVKSLLDLKELKEFTHVIRHDSETPNLETANFAPKRSKTS